MVCALVPADGVVAVVVVAAVVAVVGVVAVPMERGPSVSGATRDDCVNCSP